MDPEASSHRNVVPRVNGGLLNAHVGGNVRLVGKVIGASGGNQMKLLASDNEVVRLVGVQGCIRKAVICSKLCIC
jgi:hypothetical protein